MEDSVVGFVIDTEGCTAVEAPKYIKCCPEEEKDAVESKLEEILFGKQPFHSSAKFDAGLLESSSEKEEVGGKKRHGSVVSQNNNYGLINYQVKFLSFT